MAGGGRRASKGRKRQVKPWQEISPRGGARHIPRGSLRQITEIFWVLPILPPSLLSIILAVSCSPLSLLAWAVPRLFPLAHWRSLRQPVLRLARSAAQLRISPCIAAADCCSNGAFAGCLRMAQSESHTHGHSQFQRYNSSARHGQISMHLH